MIEVSWNKKNKDEPSNFIIDGDGNSQVSLMVNGVTVMILTRTDFDSITIKSVNDDK